jgi:hypothetical protein
MATFQNQIDTFVFAFSSQDPPDVRAQMRNPEIEPDAAPGAQPAGEPGSPGYPAATAIVPVLAAAKLVFHLLTANRYGIFRDEMYGLACADHLDWGYYSHPPGGILIAWLARHLFGDSLLALRFLPAVAGGALVWLTGRVARELGGRAFAQALAAVAVCFVPMYLVFDHWLMMNAFEPLVWLGCVWCVIRACRPGGDRYWIGFGALVGIGLELKYSMAFLAAGILLGLVATPQRRQLGRVSLWAGLALAAALALPNFLWQAKEGFPFLEHIRGVHAGGRDVVRGPVAFLLDQAVIMHPVLAPVWVVGVLWMLLGRERGRYGVFGWAFAFVVGAFIVLHGKNYYPTPVYPVAFAAGAVAIEGFSASVAWVRLRRAYFAAAVLAGAALVPLAAPVLSPEDFLRYEGWLGMRPPEFEHQNNGPLPQYFADEFGWEDMVREVARVFHTLTPAEQAKTAIFANSWGDAAAIDYFGPKYGLPRAISKSDSYWMWGPRGYTGEIVIVLNSDGSGDRRHFASVVAAGRVQHPFSRRDQWYDIFLCRGLNQDLRDLWPKMKTLD